MFVLYWKTATITVVQLYKWKDECIDECIYNEYYLHQQFKYSFLFICWRETNSLILSDCLNCSYCSLDSDRFRSKNNLQTFSEAFVDDQLSRSWTIISSHLAIIQQYFPSDEENRSLFWEHYMELRPSFRHS